MIRGKNTASCNGQRRTSAPSLPVPPVSLRERSNGHASKTLLKSTPEPATLCETISARKADDVRPGTFACRRLSDF